LRILWFVVVVIVKCPVELQLATSRKMLQPSGEVIDERTPLIANGSNDLITGAKQLSEEEPGVLENGVTYTDSAFTGYKERIVAPHVIVSVLTVGKDYFFDLRFENAVWVCIWL
jgi:hypothetical protein